MCPGSAVEGRRILGSYCTLWNGLRNARCLPVFFLFFLGLGRITCCRRRALKITGCVCARCRAGTRMFADTHLHILLWLPAAVQWRRGLPPSLPLPSVSIFKHTRWTFGSPGRRRPLGKTPHLCEKHRLREPRAGRVWSSRTKFSAAIKM